MKAKQTRREFIKSSAILFSMMELSCLRRAGKKPNIVIIFLDDSGWADFKPFGDPSYPTPNVRRLASEGCRFNNFYVPQAICSASRASLLSGCYPGRTKVVGAHAPNARGLEPKYATMGEVFKKNGYRTAVFGKWHIGDQPETRPAARGFDESCGLMYSNDMWKYHPENPEYWGKFPLRYWENNRVTIDPVTPEDQKMLTTWYTQKAVEFIKDNRDWPFFLYVPHNMPHVPLYCSDKYSGKSGAGLYGDVIMEVDWSVGKIMETLKENGLDEDTLLLFTSDNGPWISYGNHAGKTPFREAKATSFDGGTRSACIIKYPGKLQANTESNSAFCSIDILPTLCALTGTALPGNEIDGKNVWDLITEKPGAKNPHAYYAFSTVDRFESVLSGDGRWKLHLPHPYRTLEVAGHDGKPGRYRQAHIDLCLYDMRNDPYETVNVIDSYPQIADSLKYFAGEHRKKFYPDE